MAMNGRHLVSVDADGTIKVVPSKDYQRSSALDLRDYGTVDGSTSDARALRDALAGLPSDGGEVIISGGTALIDGTIDLSADQTVRIAHDGAVLVPNGFAQSLFRFRSKRANVLGYGTIREDRSSSSPGRAWAAFHFAGTGDTSVADCEAGALHVTDPGSLFRLEADSTSGYVNGNKMNGTRAYSPAIVWEFVHGDPTNQANHLSRNVALGVTVQGDPTATTDVIKDVSGISNEFQSCVVFDASGSQSNITAGAYKTQIVGGWGMAKWSFTDNGENTRLITNEAIALPQLDTVTDRPTVAAWDSLRGSGQTLDTTDDDDNRSWTMWTSGSFTRNAKGAEPDASADRIAVVDLTSIASGSGMEYVEVVARMNKRAASGVVALIIGGTDASNYLEVGAGNGGFYIVTVLSGTRTTAANQRWHGTADMYGLVGSMRAALTVNDGSVIGGPLLRCEAEMQGIHLEHTTTTSSEITSLSGTNVGMRANETGFHIADLVAHIGQ